MADDTLFQRGKPCFYLTVMEESLFANLYLRLNAEHKEAIIRMVRGGKSKSVATFFDEIAAALQFPYYFGENAAAFDECITDLDWIPGDAYLLMIGNAHLFLSDANPDHFRIVLEMLDNANEEWLTPNAYIPRDRSPTPFHILFQCGESEISGFTERLAGAGREFEVLDLSAESVD